MAKIEKVIEKVEKVVKSNPARELYLERMETVKKLYPAEYEVLNQKGGEIETTLKSL